MWWMYRTCGGNRVPLLEEVSIAPFSFFFIPVVCGRAGRAVACSAPGYLAYAAVYLGTFNHSVGNR
ncbi:hypothetical protein K461DRAFT_46342 [Myriangium duriaei CBS 260.36]|uniref:Uncharacterized protein n=1 Tax=Myriangium duriaei CBS 260.36 TaxID=1168546 RepID=A0A9P4ME01_9PEZI|nr:hypothetical protein K461DRAFT_46342 [Myriangium duriaei CBS 260.36]